MSARVLHTICDLYPQPEHERFESCVGSIASCWLNRPWTTELAPLIAAVTAKLEGSCWAVAAITQWSWRTLAEIDDDLGRRLYSQSLADEFVVHFFLRSRETIGERLQVELPEGYRAFLREAVGGLFSLYSEADAQWANGVTPDGDEFVPIWNVAEVPQNWMKDWPGYQVRAIDDSNTLIEMQREDMWVGLGLQPESLVMFHPSQLAADLKSAKAASGQYT